MANVKISELTSASAAAAANEYEINEAGTSKKVTGTQISAFVKADLLDDATVNFAGTLQNGGSNVVVDTDIGSTVQSYDADTAKTDVAQTYSEDNEVQLLHLPMMQLLLLILQPQITSPLLLQETEL